MDKKEFLDKLHYYFDKQKGNLEVTRGYLDGDGNPKWWKWKKYLDVQGDDKFLEKVNNRRILPNEIVLDIEDPRLYPVALLKVKEDFEFYSVYKTGSRGYHIHLWFKDEISKEEKEAVIQIYQTDKQKASDRNMIALEHFPHWKTNISKTLVEENSGFNDVSCVKKFLKKIEAEKEKERLKEYLSEERKKFESLGCGCLNGVFYLGTKVFRDGESYDAVVTSDKKMYVNSQRKAGRDILGENEIRFQFGLNYKESFYDESLDNIFSARAINKWLFEDCSDITIESLYEELIKIFKRYIYFEDERKYSLLACYRIAGFFMPVWKARARLFLFAEMGSAKSRLTQMLHNTGFNSVSLGDWTLAYLKTIIESTRGETHIDDFETLQEDLKNATIRLVKVGYMRGFKAGKMSEGMRRKPEVNDLFNTTTLNNTQGIDFISADRCMTIRIPKISKKEYDKEPNFEDNFWSEIRDKLYILGLKYAEQVKDCYDMLKSEKIKGRLFFVIKPELTIAKLISEELYNDLEEFLIEETEQRTNIDFESDWEFLAMKKIYELNTEDFFELKSKVVEPLGKELYPNEEEWRKKKRGFSTTIGRALAREPRFQKRVVTGKSQYKISRNNLLSLLEAKGFLKAIKDILGEPGHTGQTSPTLSTNPISPISPTKEEKQVELVEHVEHSDEETSKESIDFSKLNLGDENE